MPDFWQYPHRLDGAWPHHGHLPGPLHPLPRAPRPEESHQPARLVLRRRRRMRRARIARRPHPGRPGKARQPDLRRQLQPAAARRPGPRQRQDHPGARGRLPRRRLELHQGHLGQRLGPAPGAATGPACSCSAWARSSTANFRSTPSRAANTSASISSANIPELLKLVEHLTDEQLVKLKRGGHDPEKVYAAYKAAVEHKGAPTVILVHTVKGYGLGEAGEGKNTTHQQKKLKSKHLIEFRNRFGLPISDEDVASAKFYKPADDSEEIKYLQQRRRPSWAGRCRRRVVHCPTLKAPGHEFVQAYAKGSGDRAPSTTMAFVDMLLRLMKHKELGKYIVPIMPDEARTFGMDPFFASFKIYSSVGQLYEPVDAVYQGAAYREAKDGQILEEGITEAGSMSSFIAAGTAYADPRRADHPVLHLLLDVRLPAHRRPDLGRRRHADARLPAGRHRRPDHAQRRGPAARGRPQPRPRLDRAEPGRLRPGHGLRAGRHPARRHSADVRRSPGKTSSITSRLYNDNYADAADAGGRRRDGGHLARPVQAPARGRAGQGQTRSTCSAAVRSWCMPCVPRRCWRRSSAWPPTSGAPPATRSCAASAWRSSAGTCCIPCSRPRQSYLETILAREEGVFLAASDYMRAVPEMITPLGARRPLPAGHGRLRPQRHASSLRRHFEIDAECIAVAALAQLARRGQVKPAWSSRRSSSLASTPRKSARCGRNFLLPLSARGRGIVWLPSPGTPGERSGVRAVLLPSPDTPGEGLGVRAVLLPLSRYSGRGVGGEGKRRSRRGTAVAWHQKPSPPTPLPEYRERGARQSSFVPLSRGSGWGARQPSAPAPLPEYRERGARQSSFVPLSQGTGGGERQPSPPAPLPEYRERGARKAGLEVLDGTRGRAGTPQGWG